MSGKWFSPRYVGRLLVARLLQFFGTAMKGVFLLHHAVAPNARFEIPTVAAPLFRSRAATKVPKVFWITNYDNKVTLSLYANHLWNRLLSPTFEHRFCDDDACLGFIRGNFDRKTVEAYASLQIGAAKADYWRALVLQKLGGVYADIDAALCWPLEWMIGRDQTELFVEQKDGTITNYFVACMPDHPVLSLTVDQVRRNIEENTIRSVFHLTGPAVLDAAAKGAPIRTDETRIVCRQAMFTNKLLQYPGALHRYWGTAQKERSIVEARPNATSAPSADTERKAP
jgi:mannosyltransferase OCH1-like enzyme